MYQFLHLLNNILWEFLLVHKGKKQVKTSLLSMYVEKNRLTEFYTQTKKTMLLSSQWNFLFYDLKYAIFFICVYYFTVLGCCLYSGINHIVISTAVPGNKMKKIHKIPQT